MLKPKKTLEKGKNFLTRELWRIDTEGMSPWRFFWLRQLQILSFTVRDFHVDNCFLRASALTYTTMLSIVPLLALMVSLLKGFGVQNVLEPVILQEFAAGMDDVVNAIFRYIDNTNFGRLGWLGLVFLVLSVLTLLSNIEQSFNHIWRVQETRSIARRFSDYFSVVLLSPLLMLAAISISTSLQSQTLVKALFETAYVGDAVLLFFSLIPFLVMWAAFMFLYLFMPNTRVRFIPALIGGIFGGTLWQTVQWAYVHFQFGVGKYNAIYGTMAALPIFMVWLYVSWIIVLLGLELTYSIQNSSTLQQEISPEPINLESRQRLALTLLVLINERFYSGLPPWSANELIRELKLPIRPAGDVLADLVRLHLLSVVKDDKGDDIGYQPGRAPERLELEELLQLLRSDGAECPSCFNLPAGRLVTEIEEQIKDAEQNALDGLTLQDLIFKRMKSKEEKGQ